MNWNLIKMDWLLIERNWDYAKLHIKQRWTKLNNQELCTFKQRDYLKQAISEAYGIDLDEAETQLANWQESLINIDGYFYSIKQS
jgi:hypothetical protein